MSMRHLVACIAVMVLSIGFAAPAARAAEALPETVQFPSKDGQTQLTGFLFRKAPSKQRMPAIVMLHGRAGPYSSLANGKYDAATLSKRHAFWGHYWADRGYTALLVDSFGPRGFPAGFGIHSYGDRPDAVNEVTVRPLDAYGALAYLKSRADIDAGKIALQGWSNGGSTTLATMAEATLAGQHLKPSDGFIGAVGFYPACGLHDAFKDGYVAYAPLRLYGGDADEEVSAAHCARLIAPAKAAGRDIDITIYPGATHDFDDPGQKRQSVPANVSAYADALKQTTAFMTKLFGR